VHNIHQKIRRVGTFLIYKYYNLTGGLVNKYNGIHMGKTIIEKILGEHSGKNAKPGTIVDVAIDTRIARDFGGANVVKNITEHDLKIDNIHKTFFTFDCNPGGSDQKYASNQQLCRTFARKQGIKVFDIDTGIGTHTAIDEGLIGPGGTLVSTDSHANITGAIGAFGQGMGDQDIAYAFAKGKIWFKVPETVKITLKGTPSPAASAKDIVLAMLRKMGANGLLGFAAEIYGSYAENLSLDGRITISSMATEMGGIIAFFPPDKRIIDYCKSVSGKIMKPRHADEDANYIRTEVIDIDRLEPLVSRPGHPEDVTELKNVEGKKIDSAFIGSCTNGRLEDMKAAAVILKDRNVAPGVVLKIVPATDRIWRTCLDQGIIEIFKKAGALVGNAGCAGCASGQIGQNGPGEITVSTGNRNFAGKQGKGDVYLASPAVAAASAVAGMIAHPERLPEKPSLFKAEKTKNKKELKKSSPKPVSVVLTGRVWIIIKDNIDTDMIYHNQHLAVTDLKEMGQYTFGNLKGWEDFSRKAKPGDMIITGKNFGCGSSRQQAVDCFRSLGITLIIAESFGAIYERNAINSSFPIMTAPLHSLAINDGSMIEVNLETGIIKDLTRGKKYAGTPFSPIQMEIYKRSGLL
jgi:3-isopropylmalate/(R)-2-methylmalate dehydratase large subunit